MGGESGPVQDVQPGRDHQRLELIESVTPRVAEIAVPCLIQQGKLDTVVEPANAAWLHNHLGSARKRLAWYARSDHLLALDRQRSEVESDLLGFLTSLARPPERRCKGAVGMSQAGVREDRMIAALERMVTSRVLLLVIGLACAGLGAVAIWLPLSLFGTLCGWSARCCWARA